MMSSSTSGSGSLLSGAKMSTGMMAFVLIWALAGLAALLMSIYCTYSTQEEGNPNQNLMGFMLAILLGPFYWIYYYYARGYCGRPYYTAAQAGRL
jgi:hypothetical protein